MKKFVAALLGLALIPASLFNMSGCSTKVNAVNLTETIKPEKLTEAITISDESRKAMIDFSSRLFKESLEDGENTLIAPVSVLYALSMTANGAEGDTLEQMEKVLGQPVSELKKNLHALMNAMPSEEKYKLNAANSIWFKDADDFEVNKDFLKTAKNYYNAEVFKCDFDKNTLKEINSWVNKKTDGMISDILDKIPNDAVMYLVNALAFDAEWENIYYDYSVRDGIFTTENGDEQDAEMMYSWENVYLEDENAVGFLKYYKDRKYAFAALLPDEGVTVGEYAASLSDGHLSEILENAQTAEVNAAVPKFRSEYSVEMKEILSEMGMTDAFNVYKADFSKLGNVPDGNNIFINRVIHKTFVEVNEKGTKAGAATIVEIASGGAAEIDPEPPKVVHLDRPFIYMIIDCETNIPVFIGALMNIS